MKIWKMMFKIIGYSVTGLAFYYLIRTVLKLDFSEVHIRGWAALGCLTVFVIGYGVLYVLLSKGWHLLLENFAVQGRSMPFIDIFMIYTRSNILKYLPGNIMGFVGRNYFVSKYGIPHSDIALSSLIESVFLLFSAVVVSVFFLHSFWENLLLKAIDHYGVPMAVGGGFFVLVVLATICLVILRINPHYSKKIFSSGSLRLFSILFFINGTVFVCLGLIMIGILAGILKVPISFSLGLMIVGAFALSWACGFVIPGAPSGIGIRETVLLMVLSSSIVSGPLMVAIVMHRFVSILGDVFIFAMSYVLPEFIGGGRGSWSRGRGAE